MCPKHASVFHVLQIDGCEARDPLQGGEGINQVTVDGAGPPDEPWDEEADYEEDAKLLSRL